MVSDPPLREPPAWLALPREAWRDSRGSTRFPAWMQFGDEEPRSPSARAWCIGHLLNAIVITRLGRLIAASRQQWDQAVVSELRRRVPLWSVLVGAYASLAHWQLSPEAALVADARTVRRRRRLGDAVCRRRGHPPHRGLRRDGLAGAAGDEPHAKPHVDPGRGPRRARRAQRPGRVHHADAHRAWASAAWRLRWRCRNRWRTCLRGSSSRWRGRCGSATT